MSSRKKVLKRLRRTNDNELDQIHERYNEIFKAARKCSAEDVIYANVHDNFNRESLTLPRISDGLVAGIFRKANLRPESSSRYAKLLAKFILPLCTFEPENSARSCKIGTKQFVFCPDAEGHFVDVVEQVDTRSYCGQPRISVYHDETGTPVVLRKSFEESSALLLQDVCAEDLRIPRGTFVGLADETQATLSGQKTMTDDDSTWELESYCIENEFAIAPGRLSPWAYNSALEREMFAIQRYANFTLFDSVRADQCSRHSLSSFRRVSIKILQETGITE